MDIKRFPLGTLWTNCYLLWDGEGNAFVVDPGGEAAEVADFIKERGLKLKWVLLTHGHFDHIGGLPQVRPLSENGVAIHKDDGDALTDPSCNLSCFVGDGNSFAAAEMLLSDGQVLEIGSMRVKVIHTPGHTVGGVTFFVSEGNESLLLCGDTLFARSVGRTDLPGGDEAVLMESIKRLAVFPDTIEALPGHGPKTTIGEERTQNPYWPS